MKLDITPATTEDAQTIATVLGEIEEYYGGDRIAPPTAEVVAALFGDWPAARVLLARDGDRVVGLASVSRLWPAAGADVSLYLKELYVREGHRRRGVARQLMDAVHAEARAAGCRRVEWTADRDNPPALDLYAALGIEPQRDKVFYRSAV
ncbi:GNAT family N-acetyltransferase [Kitasatospora kifunensis]|uniref:Ribosomal protein S18 acetylase RimI-like enzyme n=1 Tax=Kitasatospora kifunensis TaxID=58351 RepID=A0A7W7VXU6_KITKI|nr:GNAT family N-acetyltransferase [Kitasatospora kifunensis]MBB4926338.1 ribosomal protein S18 acetylase RimI-like enzyme [Kitasatospora kifunensis]